MADGLNPPSRALGPFDTCAVVIGAIIGVGIFFTPGTVAGVVQGPGELLAVWIAAGLIAMLGAITFAELGRRTDRSGGQYEILLSAFGPLPAFVYVFCNLAVIQAGACAAIGMIAADHLSIAVTGGSPPSGVRLALAAGLCIAFSLANARGTRVGALLQNTTVIGKVLALVAIVGLALAAPEPAPLEVGDIDGSRVFAGILLAMFAFGGWQQALWIGGEVRDAKATVPRAIVTGVLVVVVVYVAVNWGFLRLLGHAGMRDAKVLAADAVSTVLPDIGSRLLSAAIAVSAVGVLNAQFLTGPRLVCAMAQDGRLPALLGRLHPRYRTPVPAVLTLLAFALVLLLIGWTRDDGLDYIIAGVVMVDATFFALTAMALWVFRARGAEGPKPRVLALVCAFLFSAAEIGGLIALSRTERFAVIAISAASAVGAGILLYGFLGRGSRSRPRSDGGL